MDKITCHSKCCLGNFLFTSLLVPLGKWGERVCIHVHV